MNDFNSIEVYKEVLLGKRSRFPKYFWSYNDTLNYESAREITIYLIEKILNWDDEKIKMELSTKIFNNYFLGGMLYQIYNSSVFNAINHAYPGRFHEWELACTPKSYWNLGNAKKATIWLIEEKLHWDDEKIKKSLSHYTFKEYGLLSMLTIIFNGSSFSAINYAYPGRFHEWELSYTPRHYWNLDTARVATRWLVEEKLNWSYEEAKKKLSEKIFKKYKLYGMLHIVFKDNISAAIDNAYP